MNKDFEWIVKIIAGCENAFQLHCCHNLLFNFKQKYGLTDGAADYCGQLLEAIMNKDTFISIDA